MNGNHKITALAVCTTKAPYLNIETFIQTAKYIPQDVRLYVYLKDATTTRIPDNIASFRNCRFYDNTASNFGDAYNTAARQMIADGNTSFAIANDDVMFDPITWGRLQWDWQHVNETRQNVGCVAARTNNVRPTAQNIRYSAGEPLEYVRYNIENYILPIDIISPILAVYNAEAWVDFPPINWYSDDVQCYDIRKKGYGIYIGLSYIHHIGSTTMKPETWPDEIKKSNAYLLEHRPDVYEHLNSFEDYSGILPTNE